MAVTDSDHALTGDDTSDAEASETVVETLISGRQKRSTAGRNMSSLLSAAAAEDDDDLNLLFAEDEHDEEFDEDEAFGGDGAEAGDADEMSSSEDEEDQGPNAADDDLEGERELEKQARADRKKRKAQESLRLTALRKKVKIDPSVSSNVPATAARPKKKSERISWLPTPEEGPVRSSSRRQTMQNKEMTHARLKDSEQRRIKLIATMEQAAKKKERTKPKVKSQAERLAEAEKIERMNSKSLNRWEEMEKRKAEERKAKLEALQNRRLEGPVMSWWSGVAKWVNGKLVRVGKVEVKPKPDKEEVDRKKKSKDLTAQDAVKQEKNPDEPATTPSQPAAEGQGSSSASELPQTSGAENAQTSDEAPAARTTENEKDSEAHGLLDGIHQYASASPSTETKPIEKTDAASATAPNPNDKPDDRPDDKPEEVSVPADRNNKEVKETQADVDTQTKPTADEPSLKSDETPLRTEDAHTQKEPEENASEEEERPSNASPRPEGEAEKSSAQEETHEIEMGEAPKADASPLDGESASIGADQEGDKKEQPQDTPLPDAEKPTPENNIPEVSKSISDIEPVEPVEPAKSDLPAEPAKGTETSTGSDVQPTVAPLPSSAGEGNPMDIDSPTVVATDKPLETESSGPPQPEVVEQTGRNLIILENFDNATAQSRQYSIYFNSKKPPRLTKISSHLCPITSQPSRYRDRETELPFASALAYTEIRNLLQQKYIWSDMLGCYIGSPTVAAKGVPEQFLTGVKPEKKDQDEPAAAESATAEGTVRQP